MAEDITLVADSQSFVNAFKACDDAMKRTNEFFGKTQEALSKVGTTFENTSTYIKSASDDLQRIKDNLISLDKSFSNITNTFGTLGNKLDNAGKGIQSAFQGLYGKIKAGSSVADVAKQVNEKINTSITSGTGISAEKTWTGLDSLKSLMLGLKSIQKLDKGGTVAKLSKTFLTLSNALNIISKLPIENLTKLNTSGANEKVAGIKSFLQSLTTMLSVEFNEQDLKTFFTITSSLSKIAYFLKRFEEFSQIGKTSSIDMSRVVTPIKNLIIELNNITNLPEYANFMKSGIISSLSRLSYFFKKLEAISQTSKITPFDTSAIVTPIRLLFIGLNNLTTLPEYANFEKSGLVPLLGKLISFFKRLESVSQASKVATINTTALVSPIKNLIIELGSIINIPEYAVFEKSGLISLLNKFISLFKKFEEISKASPTTSINPKALTAPIKNLIIELGNLVTTPEYAVFEKSGMIPLLSKLTYFFKKLSELSQSGNIVSFNPKALVSPIKNLFIELGNLVTTPEYLNFVKSGIVSALSGLGSFFRALESISKMSGTVTINTTALVVAIRKLIVDLGNLANTPQYSKFIELANALNMVTNAAKKVTTSTRKTTSALNSLTSTTSSTGLNLLAGGFRSIVTAFIGGSVIYSTVRAIKQAIAELIDLESTMRRINTIARESEDSLAKMTSSILDLSQATGVKKTDLTAALYEINSATIKGADAMLVLKASAYSAVAGFTETKKVAELISKILNAYGESANKAEHYSNVLFKTVERGINPMSELSQYLGNVITVAAGAGISFEEVSAAVATLTAMGYKTNVAVTSLNSAILKLAKGNKYLNKLFQDSGYASSAAAVRVLGLKKTFDLIRDATGGATEKLAELGFNYRDIRAASVLTSKSLQLYQANMDEITNKTNVAGAAQKAFAEVEKSVKQIFDETAASISTFISNLANSTQSLNIFKATLLGIKNIFQETNNALTRYNENMNLSFGQSILVKIVTVSAALISLLATMFLFKKIKAIFLGLTGILGIDWGFSKLKKQVAFLLKLGIPKSLLPSLLSISKIFSVIVNKATAWMLVIEKTYSWTSELVNITGSWGNAVSEILDNLNSFPKVIRAIAVTLVSAIGAALDILTLGIFGFTEKFGDAMTNMMNRILGIELQISTSKENETIKGFRDQIIALNKEFANTKKGTGEYDKLINKFNILKTAIEKTPGAAKELGEALKNIGGKIKEIAEPAKELEKSNRNLFSSIIKDLEEIQLKKLDPIQRIYELEYDFKITERALQGFSGFNTSMVEDIRYLESFVEDLRKTQGETVVGGFLTALKSYRDLTEEIKKDYDKITKSTEDAFVNLSKTLMKEKSLSEIIKENFTALENLKKNARLEADLKVLFEISSKGTLEEQKKAQKEFFKNLETSFGADPREFLLYHAALKKAAIYQTELSKGTQKLTKEMESLSKSIQDTIMDIDKQLSEYESRGLSTEQKRQKVFDKVTIQYEKLQEYIIPGMTPPKEELDKFKSLYADYFDILKKTTPMPLGTAIKETSAVEMGTKEAFDIIAKTVYRENKDNIKDIKDNTDHMVGHLTSLKKVMESVDKNITNAVKNVTTGTSNVVTSTSP